MKNTEILVWARDKAGLTQQQAADLLGVSRVTFNRWEKGEPEIHERKLKRFLLVANISSADIPEELAAPVAPEVPPKTTETYLPEGYTDEGYPSWFEHFKLERFKDTRALHTFVLQEIEGKDYKEREAYRESRDLSEVEANKAKLLALLHASHPEGVSLARIQNDVPLWCTYPCLIAEGCATVPAKDDKESFIYLTEREVQKHEAEAADPGGAKRRAEAKAQADREHAERTAQYEREEAEEAKRVEDELVQQRLREKRVEAKAALLLAQQEEEKRFREEQRKLREAQSNA